MAWCGLILEQSENRIINKNKCLEDLKSKNKALRAHVDELNKAHTSTLSESKVLEEKNNLEAILSNQEAFMQVLTTSLALAKEEAQKKDKEIAALWEGYIDKFAKNANHMKIFLFQDVKEGKHLGQNVDQFIVEQEEAQELVDESKDFEATVDHA